MVISTVSTVRASAADLRMFVNYHLNCGIDRMFLFFDDPTDENCERFRGDKRLTCIRCDGDYWAATPLQEHSTLEQRQLHNASKALELAGRAGVDWIVHIDSDELIYVPGRNLKSHLENVGEDIQAVTFPTLEALPALKCAQHIFEEIRWFKRSRSVIPRAEALARILGCHRAFRYGYFRGHTTGKTATRVRSEVASLGIHLPTAHDGTNLRRTRSSNAFILHFDCCTVEDWKLKWERRYLGATLVSEMRESRSRQLSDFAAAYQSGSEARLLQEYRTQCIVPRYEKMVLLALGLLRRIRLERSMFSDSIPPSPSGLE
jgi:hypothetical protein